MIGKLALGFCASALAIAVTSPAFASNDTETSPTGGQLPAGVTPIGGVVIDIIGANDNRVVSQLPASLLYRGYANTSENPVPGVASGNPLLFGTQTGYDASVLGALGGGIKSLSTRITLYDGDTSPGDFDDHDNTFSINSINFGNWSDVTTYQTTADGLTTLSTGQGFGNDVLATGFFSSTDAALLTALYNSLLSSNSLQFMLSDVDPYDNFYDFTQGIDGGLINVGTGPIVTPPPVNPPSGLFNYWDGGASGTADNGVVDGGSGVWNAANTNWTTAAGTPNGAYSPNPTNAVFQGTPGTVTVDDALGQISVTGLTFNVSGYTITGDPIVLAGPAATIAVADGVGTASDTATINSVLSGSAGLTKTGRGILILGGVNTYTGPTQVAAGTLVGTNTSFGAGPVAIAAPGTLMIDQPTAASFDNVVSGAGTLVKAGAGNLTLTADSSGFTGPTALVAGTLTVNGSLAGSAVAVGSGTTLTGTGTVGSVAAVAGGIVAPGNGIGTLTVAGPYSQAAGSAYAAELASTGQSDLLAVGGPATLAAGAQLVVTKTDVPRYVLGRRYTVLSAAGGVTGTYAVSGNTNVSLFYDLVARYDPTHVYLDVAQTRSFASVGLTPNQIAAAGGADSTTGTLHDAIGYLTSAGEARGAFDLLSGEIHATARAAAYEDSRFLREAVIDHLEQPTGRNLWFHGFGSWGRMNGDGNAGRWRRDIGGIFVGADAIQSGNLRIGVLGGYSHSRLKVSSRLSSADADDAHLGAYAGLDGPLSLKAGASYTFRMLKTRRSVAFTGFSDSLRDNYTLGIGQVFGEAGAKLGTGPSTFEPFGSLAYVHLDSGHDAELGGPARLDLLSKRSDIFFGTLGVKAGLALTSGGGTTYALKGSAGWRRAFNNRRALATFAFYTGGSDFTVAAPPIAKNVAALDLGGEARLPSGTTISVSYSGQIGDRLADHGAKASVSIPF